MITPSFALTATERVLPKLALDFTTASLDSRVTFTRALNTATVTNSSGYVVGINADLPRFDYDPVALTCKGLLIEESRVNSLLRSADFTATWVNANTSVATGSTTSPDGLLNGTKLIESVATGDHRTNQSVTLTVATYTTTFYAKAAERTWAYVRFGDATNGFPYTFFNLSTGAIGNIGAGVTARISNAGNGWYRCSVTLALANASSSAQVGIATGNGVNSYTGDGTSGIYIWGAQTELGAFPTSYIPTTTTALTRNADLPVMTSTNFSSWYTGGTSGTMVVQATPPNASQSFAAVLAFAGASPSTDFIYLGRSGTAARAFDNVAGVGQGTFSFGTWANGTAGKTSIAYAPSNVAPCFNAGTVTVNNTANVPTLVKAYIGNFSDGGSTVWNGIVSKIFYFPQRLTNAEIQAFTK